MLVGEVMTDDGRAAAGFLGHASHGRGLDAFLLDQAGRDVEDLLPPFVVVDFTGHGLSYCCRGVRVRHVSSHDLRSASSQCQAANSHWGEDITSSMSVRTT